jgi:outer membrane receptor protein involved in Fe transport
VRNNSEAWTQELRLVSSSKGPLDWIAGGYWYDADFKGHFQEHVPTGFTGQADMESWVGAPLNDDKEFVSDLTESTRQRAFFGEIGYRLTPQWRISLGARYFDYRIRNETWQIDQWNYYAGGRDSAGFARTQPLPDDYGRGLADDSGSVFRFNTSYNLGSDDLVYLTVAEGYRPGGFNEATSANPIPVEYQEFQPDSITSYELGGKFGLLGGRAYLSSAVYYIDWSDMQTQVQLPTLFGLRGNAGKAHSQGIELELYTRDIWTPGLALALGYSWNSVELDETTNGIGFKGERAPYVPQHSGSAVVDYAFAFSTRWSGGLNVAATYTGGSASDFGPVKPDLFTGSRPNPSYLELDGYWLLNLSLRIEDERWSVRAFVDNATDEKAALYLSLGESYSQYRPARYIERTLQRPRTYGIELVRRF